MPTRRSRRILLRAASLSIAIVWPASAHAYDIHFDYTSFGSTFGQSQLDVLNYPSINGNYMMTSGDNHRPEMVANGNNLAEFYNFLTDRYTEQTVKNGALAADAIDAYTVANSTNNGPKPTWMILNEISPSLWSANAGPPSNSTYRTWLIDCVTRLKDHYGYDVVTLAPFQNPAQNDASWQALQEVSYIGIECYLSGTEVWNSGATNAARLAWAQAQYQASQQSYMNRGVPESKLFVTEHFANNNVLQDNGDPTGWGRAGLASAADWDTVIQIRQDAIYNVGFAGFLAYNWGGNGMGVSVAEQLQHEYWYRTRLALPTQQPQWLADAAYSVNGTNIALSWSEQLNWLGGIPNAANAVANFYRTNTAGRTVTLDGSRTVGTLSFNSAASYTIAPGTGGTITLSGTAANIAVPQGSHTISAGVVLASNATLNVSGTLSLTGGMSDSAARTITRTGSGTLTIAGAQSYAAGTIFNANSGNTFINSDGGANLTVNANSTVNFGASQRLAALNIAFGKTATLTAGGAKKLNVGTLSVSGKLDLKDNDAIVRSGAVGGWNTSAYTGITGLIATGRNGGNWNAPAGITTTLPNSTLIALGVADASDLNITSTALWNGQTVSSTDTLIMYTYAGDATLDGKINIDDYTQIDQGIANLWTGWVNGDFNYDGKINIDDYVVIDSNLQLQGAPLGGAGGVEVVAVPEPGGVVLVMLGIVLGQRRRARRGLVQ